MRQFKHLAGTSFVYFLVSIALLTNGFAQSPRTQRLPQLNIEEYTNLSINDQYIHNLASSLFRLAYISSFQGFVQNAGSVAQRSLHRPFVQAKGAPVRHQDQDNSERAHSYLGGFSDDKVKEQAHKESGLTPWQMDRVSVIINFQLQNVRIDTVNKALLETSENDIIEGKKVPLDRLHADARSIPPEIARLIIEDPSNNAWRHPEVVNHPGLRRYRLFMVRMAHRIGRIELADLAAQVTERAPLNPRIVIDERSMAPFDSGAPVTSQSLRDQEGKLKVSPAEMQRAADIVNSDDRMAYLFRRAMATVDDSLSLTPANFIRNMAYKITISINGRHQGPTLPVNDERQRTEPGGRYGETPSPSTLQRVSQWASSLTGYWHNEAAALPGELFKLINTVDMEITENALLAALDTVNEKGLPRGKDEAALSPERFRDIFGQTAKSALDKIVLNPELSASTEAGLNEVKVPLLATVSVPTPLDYPQHIDEFARVVNPDLIESRNYDLELEQYTDAQGNSKTRIVQRIHRRNTLNVDSVIGYYQEVPKKTYKSITIDPKAAIIVKVILHGASPNNEEEKKIFEEWYQEQLKQGKSQKELSRIMAFGRESLKKWRQELGLALNRQVIQEALDEMSNGEAKTLVASLERARDAETAALQKIFERRMAGETPREDEVKELAAAVDRLEALQFWTAKVIAKVAKRASVIAVEKRLEAAASPRLYEKDSRSRARIRARVRAWAKSYLEKPTERVIISPEQQVIATRMDRVAKQVANSVAATKHEKDTHAKEKAGRQQEQGRDEAAQRAEGNHKVLPKEVRKAVDALRATVKTPGVGTIRPLPPPKQDAVVFYTRAENAPPPISPAETAEMFTAPSRPPRTGRIGRWMGKCVGLMDEVRMHVRTMNLNFKASQYSTKVTGGTHVYKDPRPPSRRPNR